MVRYRLVYANSDLLAFPKSKLGSLKLMRMLSLVDKDEAYPAPLAEREDQWRLPSALCHTGDCVGHPLVFLVFKVKWEAAC